MKMWCLQTQLFILCTVALSCVTSAAGLIHVTGYEGGEAKVPCPYNEGYQTYEKYLCTNDCGGYDVLITTAQVNKSKYSIYDDKEKRVFTATISSLSQMDAGKYWCGVEKILWDIYTEVKLDIVTDWCCVKSNNLKGIVGRPVTLKCPYPRHHGTNRKFLCKGDHRSNCTHMVTSHNNSGQTDLRFTLQDDAASSSFSVMITELEAGDAGTYWCGSDSQWSVGNYTQIQLSVDFLTSTMETVVSTPVLGTSVTGAGVNRNRDMTKAGDAGMVMDEADIYENQDVVDCSKQRLRKQHITCHHDDETGGDQRDSVYQNLAKAENIYCKDVYNTISKR